MFSARGPKRQRLILELCMIAGFAAMNAAGQEPAPTRAAPAVEESAASMPTAPVVVDGTTLFRVRGVSAYPAERRAAEIAEHIRAVAANRDYSPERLTTEESPGGTRIMANQQPIMMIYDADARLENVDRRALTRAHLLRIGEAVESFRRDREPKLLVRHALYAFSAILALIVALWTGHRGMRRARSVLEGRYREKVRGVQIQSFQIIRAEHLWRVLTGTLNVLWAIVVAVPTYMVLHYVLALFPWTRGLAGSLVTMLVNPLVMIGNAILAAVPDVVFLVVLVLVTGYLLKLIRLFFAAIETGSVRLSGFDTEWAKPTYRLVRVAVIAFALVAAYPYIPGSNSQAFKGISLLLGVIFSLGSSALIGNMISGYSMTYRRVFRQGDRVKIGGHIGDVEEMKLMVTYLRTPKNELIAVPNSVIINGEVVNYSTLAHKQGLILHTTVGIGYETSWRQVEAMLLEAAERTPGLLRRPRPFVLQKELGDFAITYEINAYCDDPQAMERLYTGLHKNILDMFNEYGVQIMTPAYECDPERAKVVPKDQWYSAPARPPESVNADGGEEREATAA